MDTSKNEVGSKVDVIIPCYNCADTLNYAAKSVLSQTCLGKLILVEDCSSDSTRDVVLSLNKCFDHIEVQLNKKNSGAGFSRNIGIKCSEARYIAFMDSDDAWNDPQHLEKLRSNLLANDWAVFAYTNYFVQKQNGDLYGPTSFISRHKYRHQLTSTLIATPAVLIDRCRTGTFNFVDRRTGQDYELWLKLLKIGDAIGTGQKSLTVKKQNGSLSKSKFQSLLDIYQVQTEFCGIHKVRAMINTIKYTCNKARAIFGLSLER